MLDRRKHSQAQWSESMNQELPTGVREEGGMNIYSSFRLEIGTLVHLVNEPDCLQQ